MKHLMRTLVGVISLGLGSAALTPLAFGHGGDPSLIHACVKNRTGALRIIAPSGTCKQNETALDWSIIAGPRLTEVWSPARVHRVLIPKTNFVITPVSMITVTLPPGDYLALATITFDFRFGGALAGCVIFPTGAGATTIESAPIGGFGGVANGVAVGTFSLPAGGQLEVRCNQNDDGPGQVQVSAFLVVQQVAEVH